MNLYLIQRIDRDVKGLSCGEYDSFVVAADSSDEAFWWNPDGTYEKDLSQTCQGVWPEESRFHPYPSWPIKSISDVDIHCLVENVDLPVGVVLASFNEG